MNSSWKETKLWQLLKQNIDHNKSARHLLEDCMADIVSYPPKPHFFWTVQFSI